jgi:hypothetical protein
MIQVTIPNFLWCQVCSDEPLEAIILYLNAKEISSAKWQLATDRQMHGYGNGDVSIVPCTNNPPGFYHYLMVTDWLPQF